MSRPCVVIVVAACLSLVPATGADGASVTVNLINLKEYPVLRAHVTVMDARGAPIVGLRREAFEIKEDGIALPPVGLETLRTSGSAMAVVLAIDRSGSMKGEPIKQALAAAAAFVRDLAEGDQVGLVAFDNRVSTLAIPSTDRAAVLKALAGVKLGGDTALNDGVAEAIARLGAVKLARKAVIALTDGKENRSATALEAVIARAREAGAPVHTVALGTETDKKALARLASETGGLSFESAGPGELVPLYRRIGEILRNQYVVTFRSSRPLDQSWRRVSVAVSSGTDRVEAMRGYLATLEASLDTGALRGYLDQQARRRTLVVGGGAAAVVLALGALVVVVVKRRGVRAR